MSAKGEKQEASQSSRAKLARRARSFKEEFLDRLSNIRSPSVSRGGSPNKSPRLRRKSVRARSATPPEDMVQKRKPEKDVHRLQKDVHFALRYFQDVIDKNTLEMLPGSASIVLETVMAIHNLIGSIPVNDQSSMLTSSCNQVYQSMANLIRWSDNVLLHGDQTHNKENIIEVIHSVRDAIKALVQLFVAKFQSKDTKQAQATQNIPKTELQIKTSLPDIPLTPREKEILEQTNFTNLMDNRTPHSLSSDNILNNNNNDHCLDNDLPPPKPPLPHSRSGNCPSSKENIGLPIPPLPPKKRTPLTLNDTVVNFGHLPPVTSSPHSSLSSLHNQLSNLSLSLHSDWMNAFCQSPQSSTPLSRSPASSISSSLNRSAEELSRHTPSMTSSDYDGATGSALLDISSSSSEHVEEINQLAHKINELTAQQETQIFVPPPVLPLKQIKLRDRFPSQYDNIPDLNTLAEQMMSRSHTSFNRSTSLKSQNVFHSQRSFMHSSVTQRSVSVSSTSSISSQQSLLQENLRHTSVSQTSQQISQTIDSQTTLRQKSNGQASYMHSTATQTSLTSSSSDDSGNKPPPLPPKKKNIMAYMQMFGSYSQPSTSEFFRHSMHSYNMLQAQWQQREQFFQSRSFTFSYGSSSSDDWPDRSLSPELEELKPPALPPKKSKNTWHLPLVLPVKKAKASGNGAKERPSTSPTSPSPPIYGELREKSASMIESSTTDSEVEQELTDSASMELTENIIQNGIQEEEPGQIIPLFQIDVSDCLVYKNPGEEGPSLRGGSIDALIVQATRVTKNAPPNSPCLKTNRAFYQRELCTYFMYQEAFLTTYRTFIVPKELIDKLLYRYNNFNHMTDLTKKRASRNTFSLLVRVVDELCASDVNDATIKILMDFVFQLLCDGELMLAKILRTKILEKCNLRKKTMAQNIPLSSFGVSTVQHTLLDFKSEHLAEQMTLLDANLFMKIEIPEVLLWAREQSEELSPNLTLFTEHFNKMSYWARSRILEQEEAKDREKYLVKFIKIMKHLRRMNNFNSYLAILSALDSAPIRRLEWQKQITEGLKEYCELIDSSSSFRAYRQALAETEPPCIPYIGLILQDLTFVHIGNNDLLAGENINFAKRWQQFNILDNMRRFKKCNYLSKPNQKIIAFFNNFDDYLCEEAMWQISESIKPRGGRKKIETSDQS